MQRFSEELLRSTWAAAWDQGRVDALDDVCCLDYTRRSSGSNAEVSLADFKAEILAIRASFPDLRTTIEEIVIGATSAAVFWTSEGTHENAFLGVPATGRRARTRGSNHLVLSGGRVKLETVTWDGSELLACLGIRSLRDGAEQAAASSNAGAATTEDDVGPQPAEETLKQFNRQFVTGVTVVTTLDDSARPRGLAVNAYASISLEPPLALVCVQKTSSSYPHLFAGDHLGINVLSSAQLDIATVFGRSGPDKFSGVSWHSAPNGSPLIDGSAAALEAEIRDRFQARTHTIFICRIRHAEVAGQDPMIYRAGGFYHSNNLRPLDGERPGDPSSAH